MFYKFVFGLCTQACDVDCSRVRFAHLPLFIDFYFFIWFLCFINCFGCARKRAMWIHLTCSLRSPSDVHCLLHFIISFYFLINILCSFC